MTLTVTHLTGMAVYAPIFLDTTSSIHDAIKPLVENAITILQVLFPLIAIFRIVYRFAEHREASMTIVVTEIVIIIFVSLIFGNILKTIISSVSF